MFAMYMLPLSEATIAFINEILVIKRNEYFYPKDIPRKKTWERVFYDSVLLQLAVDSTGDEASSYHLQASISGTSPWKGLGSSKRTVQIQNTRVTRVTKFPFARVQEVISVQFWSMSD